MTSPASIPVARAQRIAWLRVRLLPAVVFGAALIAAALLWRGHVAMPTLVGQVEPVQANVSCYKPGTLARLCVSRFQQVKAGDPVCDVLLTDPKILASSLAVIQADIEALRVGMQPLVAQQRAAVNYSQLRLDWMRQRAQLAMAKANLQFAEAELRRNEELFKQKVVSQQVLDQAAANQQLYRSQVDELAKLVEEQLQSFGQITNAIELAGVTEAPVRASIAAQESRLRLTEAELSPITLRAPIDGVVSVLFHRSGEAVVAGEPILSIASPQAVRIVGYLRPPVREQPRIGARVEVSTRGVPRLRGSAQVIEVGNQFEPIAPALLGPVRFVNLELGLPIGISIPPNFNARPGELVDIRLLADSVASPGS